MTLVLNEGTKPLPKKEAYALCRDLLAEANKSEDISPRRREALERLFMYFAPAAPAKAKDAFSYVARFVAKKNDVRMFLRYVYVSEGTMYASNGHIAVRHPSTLDDGYYCPKTGEKVNESATFPAINNVIDSAIKNDAREPLEYTKGETATCERGGLFAVASTEHDITGYAVHLLDIIANRDTVTIRQGTCSVSAVAVDVPSFPDADAVIMPMRR